jgi:site-specific recombinase XerD
MAAISRAAAAIAAILVREGVDYAQSKAVFKAARERAGLRAPPERRGGVDRLSIEEELRFLDHSYGQDGHTGLMLQTLLETGVRASELVQLPAFSANNAQLHVHEKGLQTRAGARAPGVQRVKLDTDQPSMLPAQHAGHRAHFLQQTQ